MKIEEEILQKKFTNISEKTIVNILFTNNWLMSLQAEILKKFNISVQQFNILRILRGQFPKPATIKLIKERMLDKESDASRIVEKLRLKGFVDRTICPVNRRTVDVLISKKGLEALNKLDVIELESNKLTSNLSIKELENLNELLDKLRG
jgi:DNA-binding MarR family transcriptional regulator